MTTNLALSFSHVRPTTYLRPPMARFRAAWARYRAVTRTFGPASTEAHSTRTSLRHLIKEIF